MSRTDPFSEMELRRTFRGLATAYMHGFQQLPFPESLVAKRLAPFEQAGERHLMMGWYEDGQKKYEEMPLIPSGLKSTLARRLMRGLAESAARKMMQTAEHRSRAHEVLRDPAEAELNIWPIVASSFRTLADRLEYINAGHPVIGMEGAADTVRASSRSRMTYQQMLALYNPRKPVYMQPQVAKFFLKRP